MRNKTTSETHQEPEMSTEGCSPNVCLFLHLVIRFGGNAAASMLRGDSVPLEKVVRGECVAAEITRAIGRSILR